jgi:glycosyltransferase involved in cell wall biosynthesis
MMLYSLVKQHQLESIESKVFSLVSDGEVKKLIQSIGIDVIDLDFPKSRINIFGFLKLIRELRKWKPDLIQCWMYHANLVGGIASIFAGKISVIWSLHHTNLDPKCNSWKTILVMKLSGYLSFIPKKIISCSEVAKNIHINFRYPEKKIIIIPNGIDTDIFHPSKNKTRNSPIVIGIVGRYDPQKDFPTFIEAAKILSQSSFNMKFQLCGSNLDENNEELCSLIHEAEIEDQIELLGQNSDMVSIYQGFDILVSSSAYGEAFPLVIGEAMACGVPCIATDLGDSKMIIDDSGYIVPTKDPQAIADAVIKMLSLSDAEWNQLKVMARRRIETYSIQWSSDQYLQLYYEIINK